MSENILRIFCKSRRDRQGTESRGKGKGRVKLFKRLFPYLFTITTEDKNS